MRLTLRTHTVRFVNVTTAPAATLTLCTRRRRQPPYPAAVDVDVRQAAAIRALDSCQGVRIRGPSAVTAIVNSKWAVTDPSWE